MRTGEDVSRCDIVTSYGVVRDVLYRAMNDNFDDVLNHKNSLDNVIRNFRNQIDYYKGKLSEAPVGYSVLFDIYFRGRGVSENCYGDEFKEELVKNLESYFELVSSLRYGDVRKDYDYNEAFNFVSELHWNMLEAEL